MRLACPLVLLLGVVIVGGVGGVGCIGCEPETEGVCGDGVVDEGEAGGACCIDAGCDYGTCTGNVCKEAWQSQCEAVGSGACSSSFVCAPASEDPPQYDCGLCPCAGADACYEDVCVDAATRELERFDDVVADDLDMDEYARLFTFFLESNAIPLAEAAPSVVAKLRADSRANALIAGANPAVNVLDLEEVLGVLVDAAELVPQERLDLRERREDACAEVKSAVSSSQLPEGLVVAFVPDDAAARATCSFPGTFAHCDIPLAQDCALQGNRLSVNVIVIDQTVTLAEMDQAMLLRAGLSPPDVLDVFLSQALGLFEASRTVFPLQDGFRVGNRFAAGYVDTDVLWIVLADPNARPKRTGAFRLVWNDPPSQLYLIDNDIQARDCAFDDIDGGLVLMTCDNGGFQLTATVDPGSSTLVDVTTNP